MKFKRGVNPKDLEKLQPAAWILLLRTILYCEEHGLQCRITSLISDRGKVKAKSRSHEEGRAFDIGIRGWSEFHINRFAYIMNRDYEKIAAISFSDLKPRAVVPKKDHLHIQVRPDAPYQKFV